MAMSLDGMISGMGTTDMISQLMQLEALPQTALKNKVTVQNKAVSAFQSLNTRVNSMLTATRALGTADAWGAMKATATSDAVAVSARPGATTGAMSFKVTELAAAHTVTFTGKTVGSLTDAAGSPVLSGTTIDVLLADGTTTTVTPADRSLQAVAKTINETANGAYKASAVQVSPGQYTLQLTSTATGNGNKFFDATKPVVPGDPHGTYVPAGLDLNAGAVTRVGSDAALTVGDVPATQYQITSSTNTFTDLLPGITVTVSKKDPAATVTVNVVEDKDSIASKVQALVDTANVVLQEVTSQSRPKNGPVPAGPLVGDSALRNLSQSILGVVASGADGLGSLSQVGVTLGKTGELSFNKQKFLDALAADPVKTRAFFDSYADVPHAKAKADTFEPGWDVPKGLSRKLEALAATMSEGVILPTDSPEKTKEGLLTALINRRTDSIKGLNDQVASWDRRLEVRKSALQRQFSGLEVALGKMKSQSSWLAGQLAGLPSAA
ncbi:MAG TPA: flagellar filament capping protein FliD [Pilimelia sp.]|nr:flagellar filament capping protein FliD [Pilimelia sp.]